MELLLIAGEWAKAVLRWVFGNSPSRFGTFGIVLPPWASSLIAIFLVLLFAVIGVVLVLTVIIAVRVNVSQWRFRRNFRKL